MPGVIEDPPLAGCIKWLPHKDKLPATELDVDEGCCNHPVVIISKKIRDKKVDILIITSFGGQDLEARFPKQHAARHEHLPISPSNAHPDNNILLFLENSSNELRKKSYVKTRGKHSVMLSSLQPYNRHGPEVFLSSQSFQVLMEHTHFAKPSDPSPSCTLPPPSYGLQRSGTQRLEVAENVPHVSDYGVRGSTDSHDRQPLHGDSTPRRYCIESVSSMAAARAHSPRALPQGAPYHTRQSRSTTLPITYPIQSDYGSSSSGPFNWQKFWQYANIILWICLCVLITYGFIFYPAMRSLVLAGSRL
ncbi:hypothetical protein GGS21DRAFT_386828 [Xylaria nigripes]|nr:hypothetical protein GGS21DRAFT_386828 [Xylaria nigripes]